MLSLQKIPFSHNPPIMHVLVFVLICYSGATGKEAVARCGNGSPYTFGLGIV